MLLRFPRPSLVDLREFRLLGVPLGLADGPLSFLSELFAQCQHMSEDSVRDGRGPASFTFNLPMPSFPRGFATVGFTVARAAARDAWVQPYLHDGAWTGPSETSSHRITCRSTIYARTAVDDEPVDQRCSSF